MQIPTPVHAMLLASAVSSQALADTSPETNLTRLVEYGGQGVVEVGASAGLMLAPDLHDIAIAPSAGWFIADYVELTGIMSVAHFKADTDTATVYAALVEPSYHIPIHPETKTVFAFAGMGIGAAYVKQLHGALAVAPRLGLNVMVGKAGVLTPSLTYQYTSHNVVRAGAMDDVALVAAAGALRVNIGYTQLW